MPSAGELDKRCIWPDGAPQLARREGVQQGTDPLELRELGVGEGELLDDLLDGLAGLLVGMCEGEPGELRGEEVLPAVQQLLPPGNDPAIGSLLNRDRSGTAGGPSPRELPHQPP